MKDNTIRKVYNKLTSGFFSKPIVRELPFLLFAFIMIGGIGTLQKIHGELVVPDPKVSLLGLLGNMLVAFLFAYLLTLAVYITAKKWVKITVYVFLSLLFLIVSFIERNFDSGISPQVLTLLAETNQAESSEFMNVYAFSPASMIVYGQVLLLTLLIVISELFYGRLLTWIRKRSNNFLRLNIFKKIFELLTIVIVSISIIYAGVTYTKLFTCSTSDECSTWQPFGPQDTVSDIIFSLYVLNIAEIEVSTAIEVTKEVVTNLTTQEGDSINILLVIGESHIKWHSSLYGYPIQTNPLMEKEKENGNLFVFEDVNAPFIRTSDNIKNMLSCNSIGLGEKWYQCPFFPAMFKKVGFHVSFFDNQGNGGKSSMSFALNSFLYNEDILALSYNQLNDTCFSYDGDIVDYYTKVKSKGKRNLVIFHLQGQHVEASEKYPHSTFSRFSKYDIHRQEDWIDEAKRQTIAEYDNATLYNDYVLRKIASLYEEENTVMIYLSDHGEEVYDFRNQYGRKMFEKMTSNYVKYIYEIPFMIWCSDKFIESHPTIVSELIDASTKSFSSDNLCHILFYLGSVKTNVYQHERNPLTKDYQCPKRVIEAGYDFDECR